MQRVADDPRHNMIKGPGNNVADINAASCAAGINEGLGPNEANEHIYADVVVEIKINTLEEPSKKEPLHAMATASSNPASTEDRANGTIDSNEISNAESKGRNVAFNLPLTAGIEETRNVSAKDQPNDSMRKKVSSTLSEYAEMASVNGPKRIVRAKSRPSMVAWSVIFLGVVCMAVYLIVGVVVKYYTYPIQDGITIKTQPLAFPAVTLCPFIPNSMSDLKKALRSKEAKLPFANLLGDKITETMIRYHISAVHTRNMYEFSINPETFGLLKFNGTDINMKKIFQLREALRSSGWLVENVPINDFSRNLLKQIKSKDFIMECTYNDKACDDLIDISISNTVYGRCFTLNVNESIGYVQEVGPDKGLVLLLYTGRHNPLQRIGMGNGGYEFESKYAEPSDGVKVVVHKPGTMPRPYSDGFFVTPGRLAAVGITQSERTRLLPPHGECTDAVFNTNTTYKYTYEICVDQCIQERIKENCGCVSPMFPVPKDHDFKRIQYCGNISDIFKSYNDNETSAELSMFSVLLEYTERLHASEKGDFEHYIDTILSTPELRKQLANTVDEIIARLQCENHWMISDKDSCKCKRQCKENEYTHLINTIPWPEKSVVDTGGHRGFVKFFQKHKHFETLMHNLVGLTREIGDLHFYRQSQIENMLRGEKSEFRNTAEALVALILTTRFDFMNELFLYTENFQNVYGISSFTIATYLDKFIDTNFLKLNIHFESLDVRVVYEERTYTYASVIKDIGNVFGFYLGMSVFSVMEAVFMICLLIKLVICQMVRSEENDDDNIGEQHIKGTDDID
ncbi:unnamed protein product [Owenia fusiformis]|uniref:Uncharacterized protein n=1 Tax=Owenia fusiformis TaxID=6347 RepID=A0A8J1XR66_OWEFU|nr:unnamed protein product [Owenia fusiformis]